MQSSAVVLRHSNCLKWLQSYRPTALLVKYYSEDSSSSDSDKDEKDNKYQDKKLQQEIAQKRLKDLLLSFNKSKESEPNVKVENYRPKAKEKRTKEERQVDKDDERAIDFAMRRAVKDVAKDLGGNTKLTESELLASVKSHTKAKADIGNLISKMKVDSEPIPKESARDLHPLESGPQVPFRWRRDQRQQRINIFGGNPLGIFKPVEGETDAEKEKQPKLGIWDAAYERELQVIVSHSPRNYFEEMIQWTEKGMFWQFPIDNEAGLEEEKKYSFADHIFLERHLEGWCPQKGPIRHFMELVCVGLSKNPYITVDRKKAHIEWYKDYFANKEDVLKSVGAI